MKTAKILFSLTLATTLIAGIGSLATADLSGAAASDDIELAQPQPEFPICPRCYLTTENPGELVMAIDASYEGELTSATLVTYDASNNPTSFPLSSAVVDDLNDPTTNVTVVSITDTDAVAAEIDFVTVAGSQTDTIWVF